MNYSLTTPNRALFGNSSLYSMAQSNVCGFPGYSVQKDLTLLSDLDKNGDMLNPDLICNVNVFCDTCQGILLEAQTLHDALVLKGDKKDCEDILHVPFYESEDEIGRSVERGCHLCTIFLVNEEYRNYQFSRQGTTIPNGLKSWITFDKTPGQNFKMYQYRYDKLFNEGIFMYLGPTIRSKPQPSADQLSASISSEHSLQLALSWLKTCLKYHQCQPGCLRSPQMPKRLLYVGDTASPQLRVIFPRTHISYLTVSHCWSGIENLTLRLDTYNELTNKFNDHQLPRLWRDCVNVTRRLGFEYLWIDSCVFSRTVPSINPKRLKKWVISIVDLCAILLLFQHQTPPVRSSPNSCH